jgi:hypothetical protein
MIRKNSKRRAAQVRQYNKRVKVWKEENPVCKADLPGCSKQTVDCHHRKGKIELLLLDETYWLPVCRHCHNWIERNPNAAKEKGLSLSRLAVN